MCTSLRPSLRPCQAKKTCRSKGVTIWLITFTILITIIVNTATCNYCYLTIFADVEVIINQIF